MNDDEFGGDVDFDPTRFEANSAATSALANMLDEVLVPHVVGYFGVEAAIGKALLLGAIFALEFPDIARSAYDATGGTKGNLYAIDRIKDCITRGKEMHRDDE